MKFSEGRQSYLAHLMVATLQKENLADIVDERHALVEIKRVLGAADSLDAAIDTAVRRRIESLSRRVPVGSREWDILYRQYTDDERKRRSR